MTAEGYRARAWTGRPANQGSAGSPIISKPVRRAAVAPDACKPSHSGRGPDTIVEARMWASRGGAAQLAHAFPSRPGRAPGLCQIASGEVTSPSGRFGSATFGYGPIRMRRQSASGSAYRGEPAAPPTWSASLLMTPNRHSQARIPGSCIRSVERREFVALRPSIHGTIWRGISRLGGRLGIGNK